jgi:hypothetical protein
MVLDMNLHMLCCCAAGAAAGSIENPRRKIYMNFYAQQDGFHSPMAEPDDVHININLLNNIDEELTDAEKLDNCLSQNNGSGANENGHRSRKTRKRNRKQRKTRKV